MGRLMQVDSPANLAGLRSRKIAAMFAGGLVVALGIVSTLATSGGVQLASGSFAAGAFDLQGSVDGWEYADHLGTASSPVAALTLSAEMGNLSPNDRIYVPFAVRLAKGGSYAARVTVRPESTMGAVLSQYSVYRTGTFGCSSDADLATATVLLDGELMQAPATFDLARPSPGSAGVPVGLCFVAVIRPDLAQGGSGAFTWSLQGESLIS
jgi:hypothetical protein